MATSSSPPSPLYDPAQRDMYAHCYPQQPNYLPDVYHARDGHSLGYFYLADSASVNSLDRPGTHAHDAVAARLTHNQLEAFPQYHVDAAPGVISYATEYIIPSGHDWQQHKHAQAHTMNSYTPVPFYDEGEVSPSSDDSTGTFYDSPQPSDDGAGADLHPAFAGYDAAVITAEQYSHLAGQGVAFQQYARPTYYHQPAPQAHLSSNNDFGSSEDDHPHDYLQRPPSGDHHHSPARFVEPRRSMTAPQRTQSPMAHLPYVEADNYSPHPPQFYLPPSTAYAYADSPVYPQPQHRAPFPAPITIPGPRSPPLVEDMPKKPLTLACFFCRKRKIACGSPQLGKKDRTCNQCARRNLRCEYPVNSRRGTRQREAEAALYPGSAGYARASS